MLRRLPFLLALGAMLASACGQAPTGYAVETTVAAVPTQGREPFGSKFFFAAGNLVIYRILPDNRSDTDPAPNWQYSSPAARLTLLPLTGYESLDIVALNPAGTAVGRSVTENSPTPNPHQEAALSWTPVGGSTLPPGFDAGASGLKTLNAAGQTAGFTDSGTYRFVRWSAANPATPDDITPPPGYPYAEVHGISGAGEVLLYVTDNLGKPRLAIWDGTSSAIIGPAPDAGETFSSANCAINGVGDAAMLLFTAGGNYRIVYVSAANRAGYQIFPFTGPVSSAYRLQISDAGLASCQTSANQVSIVSSPRARQFTFAGYSPFLNDGGEFVFGNQSVFYHWDAAAWTGAPVVVPLSLPAAPTAPTLVGFNNDGRLLTLSDNAAQTVRTLSILAPAFPTPAPIPAPAATVTVTPVRKTLRLTAGLPVRQPLVRPHVSGWPDGAVRYALRGSLPAGLRFRAGDGSLRGRPTRAQRVTLRVAAAYSSAGIARQSAFVKIKVVLRAPASPPTE